MNHCVNLTEKKQQNKTLFTFCKKSFNYVDGVKYFKKRRKKICITLLK